MTKPEIFVSFRSKDTLLFKQELVSFLEKHFEGVTVHTSSDIRVGRDWWRTIERFIDHANIMIILAGPKWEHGDGKRDIKHPKDVVRREVARGLKRAQKGSLRLMTILVDRTDLDLDLLPKELHPLKGKSQWALARADDLRSDLLDVTAEIYKELEQYRPKPVVLISSTLAFLGDGISTEGLDYFTTLVMTIIQMLKNRDRDVILKVPIYAASVAAAPNAADNQRKLLEETIQHLDDYSGIIVAPFDLEYLRHSLARLLSDRPAFPLCTIDKCYDPKDTYFSDHGARVPAGFVCDGFYNGGLAANCVLRYIEKAGIEEPNIVILQGLQGSKERIEGFLSEISSHNDRMAGSYVNVYVSIKTQFIASEGYRRAKEFLCEENSWTHLLDAELMKGCTNHRRQLPLKVIAFFCCNDEMALGVRDYMEKLWQVERKLETAVIVGFDGISTVRRHITNDDPWLLNSVDVRVNEQVTQLAHSFVDAVEQRTVVNSVDPIRGTLVDPHYDEHISSILRAQQRRRDTL